jgi:YidC/Oxa1 family membrane protein insertase
MDKRLFLALLLTALVVVMTPVLFPTPRPPRSAIGDTSAVQRSATSLDPVQRSERAEARPAPSSTAVGQRPSSDTSRTLVATPDSVTVRSGGSTYRFLNLGATPVSVTLDEFPSLGTGSSGSVDLVRPGDQLLRYRLVIGADTLALDTIPMQSSVSRNAQGQSVVAFTSSLVTLRSNAARPSITLTYTILPGSDAHLAVVNGQVGGLPPTRALLLVDLPRTLRTAEADTLEDLRHLSYAFKRGNEEVSSINFGKLNPATPRLENGPLSWVAVRNKYFIAALIGTSPDSTFAGARFAGVSHPPRMLAREGQATVVMPLEDGTFRFQVYAGPQKYTRLNALGRDLENVNQYGGWLHGFVQPFATIVMRILLWIKRTTALNYGWVLVIFGIMVRLLIWPLNQSAMRSSIRMQRLQPQLQEIQKKYRTDPERQREALMKLYQEHGMNPFAPILGCLPMLLPMPVLFALYFVFQNTIEFRGVSFLWLPDLALKDPFYVTPLLMGLSMLLLSWIGMKGAPQTPQTKMIGYMMPAMMTVLFWNFPSGLNLYYGVQNLVALPQQWLLTRERVKAGQNQGSHTGTSLASSTKPPKTAKASGAAKAR